MLGEIEEVGHVRALGVDPLSERVWLYSWHTLHAYGLDGTPQLSVLVAYYLHASGEVDRAEAELEARAELLAGAGDWVALHVVWLRARIAWSRENLPEAERLFLDARERSIARGVAFDTSLISLELALVHLVKGGTGEVERLATEASAVFAEQEVERETLAALELVVAAARREALTREMVERAVAVLRETPSPRAGRGRAS